MKKPYRDFDFTKELINEGSHFISPKARKPDVIALRKSNPKGTTIKEYQRAGARVGGHLAIRARLPEDIKYTFSLLSSTGVVSGLYELHNADDDGPHVMRRRGKLLYFGDDPEAPKPTPEDMLVTAYEAYEDLIHATGKIVTATANRAPNLGRVQIRQGRVIANMALAMSCVSLDDIPPNASPFAVSDLIREQGLNTVKGAHRLAEQIGTAPSLAQLADPYSDLSVHINRTAPDGVAEAFEEATEMYAIRV